MQRANTPLTEFDKETYKNDPLAIWVWRASPGACITCQAMDGRKYTYDAVPSRPHPNCNCTVEAVPSALQSGQLGEGLRNTARDVSEWARAIAKEKGDRMRAELEYRYGKKEAKGWSMMVMDFFMGETTPFSVALFKEDVKRQLQLKAEQFSDYPLWEKAFTQRAESYSTAAAAIDFYYYGGKSQKAVNDIEIQVKRLESGRH
ncbi:hypothetical protein [Megalodesulfovibrio paquesii]